jgi:hypothetical protein
VVELSVRANVAATTTEEAECTEKAALPCDRGHTGGGRISLFFSV